MGYACLTQKLRQQMVAELQLSTVGPPDELQLKRGAAPAVAARFGVSRNTVLRVWKRAKDTLQEEGVLESRSHKADGINRRGSFQHDREAVKEALVAVDLGNRATYRQMSAALGLPLSTLHRMAKVDGIIKPHTSSLKPFLSEQNKVHRMMFAADKLDPETKHYDSSYDTIHVDEKWFHITKKKGRYYLAEGESPPQRSVKNKNSIGKVMFLAAVARPRYDADGVCTFDGKIGMWPFTTISFAQRASVNRPRGAPVTQCVTVDRGVYRDWMCNKMLPALRARWPDRAGRVYVQQDNATPHMSDDDPIWRDNSTRGNWDVQLVFQPPNSPDTNTCDLSFLASLESRQWSHGYVDALPGLCDQVLTTFDEYDPTLLAKAWITVQSGWNQILEEDGSNHYKIPHLSKDAFLRLNGFLPDSMAATEAAVAAAALFRD